MKRKKFKVKMKFKSIKMNKIINKFKISKK